MLLVAGSTVPLRVTDFWDKKNPGTCFGLGVFHKDTVGVVGLSAYNAKCVKVVEIEHARILGRGMLDRHVAFSVAILMPRSSSR